MKTFQEITARLQGLFGAAILEVAPEGTIDPFLKVAPGSVGQLRDLRIVNRTRSGRVGRLEIITSTASSAAARKRHAEALQSPGSSNLTISTLLNCDSTSVSMRGVELPT